MILRVYVLIYFLNLPFYCQNSGAIAIYRVANMLLKPGDNVVVAGPNYFLVNHLFRRLGWKVHFY